MPMRSRFAGKLQVKCHRAIGRIAVSSGALAHLPLPIYKLCVWFHIRELNDVSHFF